jgi:hypothetical protein
MATQGPDADAAAADDLSYIIDDGLLTEEDIKAVRAWKANPVGVPDEEVAAMIAKRLAKEG